MTLFLAIDYGLERLGVAISDPEGKVALPLRTLCLARYGNRKQQLDELAKLAHDYGAEAMVFGLPLHEDGSESMMSRQIRNVAERMRRRLQLPVYFEPEYLSSFEAESELRERGIKKAKIKSCLDAQAASRILTSFLAVPEQSRERL